VPLAPSTTDISDSIVSQLEANLSQTIPLLPKAFTRVLAKALAGALIILYKYAAFTFLQMFVQYASAEETVVNGKAIRPLVELGRLIGVGDPANPTRAELVVAVTVTSQTGSLAAGSQLVYSPTNVVYVTKSAVELNASTVSVTVKASSDPDGNGGAGAIGNLQIGDELSFANPLPNVATVATVTSSVVTGADAEDIELSYRPKILRRFQARPQGGAYADYQAWAEEVEGVLHAYPYTGDPGQVDVYVEATEASSGSEDGIPTGPQLTAVAAYINASVDGLPNRRPANVVVNVEPITRTGFEITVSGLTATDMSAAEAALEAAAYEHLRSLEPHIEGLTPLPKRNVVSLAGVGGVLYEAANSVGASFTNYVVEETGVGAVTNRFLGEGEKAKLDSIAFT
jgi:uncharacterized phage protein gp47/JayE